MYCYYPDGHHSCDCREPEPPSSPLPNSNRPPSQAATQLQESPYSPSPLHELGAAGGCKGVWIYVCYPHLMDSYGLHHHPPPHVDHLHRPPCMAGLGCCRQHVSTDVDGETPLQVVTDNNQKKEAIKKCFTDDKPTVRVYCKAKTDFSLTIRAGKVILAPSDPHDHRQHWVKDERFGINVKDEEGHSSFALVNKATGQAIKHSIGVKYPLTEYNPDKLDKSVLWSMSNNLSGYRSVRAVDNIHLNLDGHKGTKDHGGVKDGTEIFLWDWADGDNQKWTIIGYFPADIDCDDGWTARAVGVLIL